MRHSGITQSRYKIPLVRINPRFVTLESFGFGLPPLNKALLYLRALQIATIEPKEPKDFPLLLPSDEELVVMDCEGVKHLTKYIIN